MTMQEWPDEEAVPHGDWEDPQAEDEYYEDYDESAELL